MSKKFIYIISSFEHLVKKKDGVIIPVSIYGQAKKASSEMAQAYCNILNIEFIKVQFTNCFGIGDKSNRSTNRIRILTSIYQNHVVNLTEGTNQFDWDYIDDIVRGIYSVYEKGVNNKTYYLGNIHIKTLKEIIDDVINYFNFEVVLIVGVYKDDAFIDYAKIGLLSAKKDLGFVL